MNGAGRRDGELNMSKKSSRTSERTDLFFLCMGIVFGGFGDCMYHIDGH